MYYRSDWPEKGFETPLNDDNTNLNGQLNKKGCQIIEKKFSGSILRCVLNKNEFESELYKFPIYELFFTVTDSDEISIGERLNNGLLQSSADEVIQRLVESKTCLGNAYIAAKLVKHEPFYKVLVKHGFDEVENRRLYICKINALKSEKLSYINDNIKYTSLVSTPQKQYSEYRDQILDICEKAFGNKGFSRHFCDPFLIGRQSGKKYILSVMALNFTHVPLNQFLIATDSDLKQIYGFSVVGKKPGLKGDVYSQLLSAIQKEYRGRGIYRGLTVKLYQSFPKDATLLNVTHVANEKIQRAYKKSGRQHLSDTVILRRVFKN